MANIDTTQSALPAGTVLKGGNASYTLLKTLGQGSFGITYLAKNIVGEDEVEQLFCIKEFFMRDINGRESTSVTSSNREGMFDYYKRKFEQESDHLSRLRHKNIVMVVDAFRANSTSYYVMQYIDGQSLDSLIAAKGRLSTDETVGITRQVGSALSCMHSMGMLHLDVKHANVMMADEKTAILIDFGLSKQYDQNGQPESSTTVGSGTPGYAPIEQANHRKGKDFPVQMDVYALGATMLKMLTGQRPPEASDILNFGFPKKELLAVGVTSSVAMVVEKAMAPQQNKRYKTVNDFPKVVSYNRFVELQKTIAIPLAIFIKKVLLGKCTGISFVDSTPLRVCRNQRILIHKTFKGIAQRGKCSMGWFFGFKLHLICNEKGELLNFMITPGDIDDRKPLEYKAFVDFIYGKLVGDKGYISKNLFDKLFVDGIQLITKLKSNMKGSIMKISDRLLLRKRAIIETVNDELKNIAQVEHSRHRSFDNFIVNTLGALAAYCFFPKKPTIAVQRTIDRQLTLF